MHKTIKLSALSCKIQWEVNEDGDTSCIHLTFSSRGRGELWWGSLEAFEADCDDLDITGGDVEAVHDAVDVFVEANPDPLG